MKVNLNKRDNKIIGITLFAGLFLGWLFFHGSDNITETPQTNDELVQENATVWTCSMHPQIRMNKPGKCPICGMDLIPVEKYEDSREAVSSDEIRMSEAAMKLADVQTMLVTRHYSNKEVYLLGKVKPDERNIAELTARFGGRIENLFVNFTGQHVSRGEKLASIYSPELVTAQKELLEAVEYKQSSPSYYKAARNKLKLWDLTEMQIEGIEANGEPRSYFEILSPISGTVTMRHVALGDYIKEGNALFQVIDLSKVWVMFDAYESDLPWIRNGDDVQFTVQSLPGKTFKGKISYIDPFLNAKTRVANVRTEVKNPGLQLKPEMFVNGVIKSGLSGNQKDIMIPKTSILWTGKRAVVYIKVPGREHPSFKYREIVLGPEAGEFYLVKEGLAEGEEIAFNGVFKIDAAAQLAGKPSMMNPGSGKTPLGHSHHEMNAEGDSSERVDRELKKKSHEGHKMEANVEQTSFKVSGNCSMCKERIEAAAKTIAGVNSAEWDMETKMIKVSFNKGKTSLADIHKAIAHAGHDTEKETTPQQVYDNLPACCQYTRE
jgi:Cu(I)/Ag(I) efflux system membrane fusion protein